MSTHIPLPTARDWMSTSIMSFSPDMDLFAAIDELLKYSFAAAPVIDQEDCLLGMLTEKDCLRVLSRVAYDDDFGGEFVRVRDFHSAVRVIAEPDMDLFRVSELFLSTNFPLLPVVEENRLCGVISRRDMLRGIRAFRRDLARRQAQQEQEAGHQADRPRSIESMQRTVAGRTREQLVRLFARR